jgi:hypothetical protein
MHFFFVYSVALLGGPPTTNDRISKQDLMQSFTFSVALLGGPAKTAYGAYTRNRNLKNTAKWVCRNRQFKMVVFPPFPDNQTYTLQSTLPWSSYDRTWFS